MTVVTSVPNATTPDTRESRALALYRTRRRDIVLIDRDTYEVPSQDGTRVYEVVYGGEAETCTCADFVYRNVSCVHLLATGACRARRRGQSRVPDHERIRLDAAANPQRSYREHIEASRDICGETYVEDLRRIQRSSAANAARSRDLEAEDLGL